eukprot:gene14561-4300_t
MVRKLVVLFEVLRRCGASEPSTCKLVRGTARSGRFMMVAFTFVYNMTPLILFLRFTNRNYHLFLQQRRSF